MKYVFSKPYEFEGKTFNDIDLALDSLKGSDISAVKKQFAAGGNFAVFPTVDTDFCILLAARLAKQPVEFFNEMPAPDYCSIAQQVSNFLIGSALS